MPRTRPRAIAASALVSLTLALGPRVVTAAPGSEAPIEGPQKPDEDPEAPDASGEPQPPAPDLAPHLIPDQGKEHESPGIEFAIPPPEEEGEAEAVPVEEPLSAQFPDPGVAPNDGMNMLVLGGTTLGLTVLGTTAGLIVGLQNGIDRDGRLPSTIVPAVGLLAFSGGGLYLGIKRAMAYRRWEIGYRVIGLPQGGGLMVGGSITLLAALGFIPAGVVLLKSNTEWGAAMIAVGAASAVATPIMFAIGVRNQRRYQRTGGWKRRPIPPLPPGAVTSRLELQPFILPLRGGVGLGAGGRF